MLKCIEDINLFSKLTYNPEKHGFDQFNLIAYTIAKIHCSTIEVKRKLGKGTVFTTILPLDKSS